MDSERLDIYRPAMILDRRERLRAEAARGGASAEVTPGGPPYRVLWCRITSGTPGDPPDERYFAEEVRPTGLDAGGHLTWDRVPWGESDLVIHNVAEAALGTHLLPEGAVVRVEERLDRSSPPETVRLAHVPVAMERLARIVAYSGGAYTVQPVRREDQGYVDDGPEIGGVANLGELWPAEAGYLAGPEDFDHYVRIFWTPAGWSIVLHPPRMV